ncbi:putative leucine-rich repeat domain, L domain-containing protein [Rosa chinensis]|uniref:Putative leucine-rich repeat domain, L domain-containing protein n=1 Tax=Rosa chinensis TaxID=74649 RepID=A0A2P6PZQ2_ROSCH|nr:putative leucine-rich repeat domain, L domain-containing protein [Rosa chinensis]
MFLSKEREKTNDYILHQTNRLRYTYLQIPVLRSLVAMSIGGCHSLRTLLSPSIARGLVKLKALSIFGCEKIEEIVAAAAEGDEETEDDNIFPQLTELSLKNLPNLRTLLSPSIARGLVKLETLEIENCEKIEEIVAAAAEGDEETEDDNIFPQLTELSLHNLPNLRSFSQGKCNFKWPLVKFIRIRGCCNMKKFCFGSVSIPWEVRLDVSDVGENVLQELKNSRKEK